jgi:excisionase family DNA binding protein
MLATLAGDAQLESVGIPSERALEHRVRPLLDHLADFEAELRTKPRRGHKRPPAPKQLASRIRRALEGCGFTAPADLADSRSLTQVQAFLLRLAEGQPAVNLPAGVEVFTLAEVAHLLGVKRASVSPLVRRYRLEAHGDGKKRRFSRATVAKRYWSDKVKVSARVPLVTAPGIKTFTRWLAKRDIIAKDPLAEMPGAAAGSAHRHDRRSLSVDELRKILAAALSSEVVFRGMAGRDRCKAYLAAIGTGFRASEIACLTPANFDLEGEPPTAALQSDQTKNGKGALQPLPSEVARPQPSEGVVATM